MLPRLALVLVLLAAGGASLSGPAAATTTACAAAGMERVTVAGRPGFRFCGPATAIVHLGARTLRFRDGLCRRAAGAFTVNIGTTVPGLRTGKPPYFGLTTHTARPGRQLDAAVGFTAAGRGYAVASQVVILAAGLRGGTFSGRVLGSTTRVSGSFRC